jgi:serine/threonine-protein kinase
VQCIHAPSARHLTLQDGRTVSLLEILGSGSLGTVYRGVLESAWRIQRPVAIKILRPDAKVEVKEAMRHVARVARRAACVHHPCVTQLFEVDRAEGINGEALAPFVVTELVDGEPLKALIAGWAAEGRRVPVDFAVLVTLRAAEALAAALFSECPDGSLTSLVHGDLSPRQILISSQGEVKVSDFALCPLRSAPSAEKGGGRFESFTRLAHTAPEVAAGAFPSPESDVFALGVVLHELLVGPRFAATTTPKEALEMVRRGDFHSSLLEPNLPKTLREVIERATARSPLARYPHARAMASELRREMLQLGLCDAQTCVRHAIVGWSDAHAADARGRMKSGIVLHNGAPEAEDEAEDAAPNSGDTEPSLPVAIRR